MGGYPARSILTEGPWPGSSRRSLSWWRWCHGAAALSTIPNSSSSSSAWWSLIAGIAAQSWRVVDPQTTSTERRSARLLGAALLPAFATGLLWLGARAAQALGVQDAHHVAIALQSVFPAVFAIVPVVLFAGILRYRLWNIDWLITHALLYGALALSVSMAYVVVVALVGLGAGGTTGTVVIVLSLVAVAIDPVRRWLRSWCNRLVYGQVVTPAEAVRTLLSSLDQSGPNDELAQLTRTVTLATRARRSELWLTAGDHLLAWRPTLRPMALRPSLARLEAMAVPIASSTYRSSSRDSRSDTSPPSCQPAADSARLRLP